MKTTELRNLIKETIKEISEDAAMKKSALGMAMYGKKAKMERARYKDGGPPMQEQAGEVNVFGENKEVAEAAKEKIELLCAEPEVGKDYDAVVAKIMEFGAFVTFMPGKDGLLHISQFKEDFDQLTDVINEGDKIRVKVTEIRRDGKIKLEFSDSEQFSKHTSC